MAASAKRPAARAKDASEDLVRQIGILKEEVARLSGELKQSKQRSAGAAKRAAADGMEVLKAQGEAALAALRDNSGELEAELAKQVREKPFTSLAIAAGAGFLLALLARR